MNFGALIKGYGTSPFKEKEKDISSTISFLKKAYCHHQSWKKKKGKSIMKEDGSRWQCKKTLNLLPPGTQQIHNYI